eukprot:9197347-Ditylum_brightwellii.AAC.1
MEVTKETLVQLGKERIKEVAENLKHPGGWIRNPDKEANQSHAMVPQTPYLFGARTQKRLLKASELMRYYGTVGHHVTVSSTVYKTVIKFFTNQ